MDKNAVGGEPVTWRNGGMLFRANRYDSCENSYKSNPAFKIESANSENEPQPARLDEDDLHEVYTDFLAQLSLHPHHLAEMTDPHGKRQMSREQVESFGVKSIPTHREKTAAINFLVTKYGIEKLLKVPGFKKASNSVDLTVWGDGVLIPSHDGKHITGIRAKIENFDAKYIWLTSAKTGGPGALLRASVYQPLAGVKPGVVAITEGEFKSRIAADKLGVTFISTPGVGSWKGAQVVEKALKLAGKGGKAVICYDNDNKTNQNVLRAENKLAGALKHAGLEVWIAYWDGSKGIDDLLLTGGKYRMRRYFPDLNFPVDQVVNTRFLDTDLLSQTSKKVVPVKALKGGGKTKIVADYTRNNPDADCLSLTHRANLSLEQSRRLGYKFYQEFKNKEIDRDGMTNEKRLTMCVDSLVHLNSMRRRDLVILDEVEQLLAHLTTSDTLKDKRVQVWNVFLKVLEKADKIICLDADLSDVTYNFFASHFGAENIEVIVNE
jgi:hypothetical protein